VLSWAGDTVSGARRFGAMPLDTMTTEQRRVAEAIMSGPRQQTAGLKGPFEALLHSPVLADPAQQLGACVRYGSSLPTILNELAIVIVARRWTTQYEWYYHRAQVIEAGLDAAAVDAIAAGRQPTLDPDASVVYKFVTELLDDGHVSDEAFADVVSRWGKRGAIDLISTVGYYTLVSFVLNTDRYPIPEGEQPLKPL
jgi:4-carboxymuconolactone decarboxylase